MLLNFLSDVIRHPELAPAFVRDPAGYLQARYPALSKAKKNLLITRDLVGLRTAVVKEIDKYFGGVQPFYAGPQLTFALVPAQGAADTRLHLELTATAVVGALPDLTNWTVTFQKGAVVVTGTGTATRTSETIVWSLEAKFPSSGEYQLVLLPPVDTEDPIVANDKFQVL